MARTVARRFAKAIRAKKEDIAADDMVNTTTTTPPPPPLISIAGYMYYVCDSAMLCDFEGVSTMSNFVFAHDRKGGNKKTFRFGKERG